jgi:DNA mismatch endonuclease (patch repair protein)
MALIRSANTKPERLLRSALWKAGLRYRAHARTVAGRPDIVFRRARVAVYVDGCQWHGCPVHYTCPRSRREFWGRKLATSVERDRRQTLLLEADGWTVLRVWEHEVLLDVHAVTELVSAAVRGSLSSRRIDMRVFRVEPIDPEGDWERRHLQDLRDPECACTVLRKRRTTKAR